jgi:hypothetical protein
VAQIKKDKIHISRSGGTDVVSGDAIAPVKEATVTVVAARGKHAATTAAAKSSKDIGE